MKVSRLPAESPSPRDRLEIPPGDVQPGEAPRQQDRLESRNELRRAWTRRHVGSVVETPIVREGPLHTLASVAAPDGPLDVCQPRERELRLVPGEAQLKARRAEGVVGIPRVVSRVDDGLAGRLEPTISQQGKPRGSVAGDPGQFRHPSPLLVVAPQRPRRQPLLVERVGPVAGGQVVGRTDNVRAAPHKPLPADLQIERSEVELQGQLFEAQRRSDQITVLLVVEVGMRDAPVRVLLQDGADGEDHAVGGGRREARSEGPPALLSRFTPRLGPVGVGAGGPTGGRRIPAGAVLEQRPAWTGRVAVGIIDRHPARSGADDGGNPALGPKTKRRFRRARH